MMLNQGNANETLTNPYCSYKNIINESTSTVNNYKQYDFIPQRLVIAFCL